VRGEIGAASDSLARSATPFVEGCDLRLAFFNRRLPDRGSMPRRRRPAQRFCGRQRLKKRQAEIAAFYKMAVQTGAKLSLAAPIRASHGSAAAMAFDVQLNMPAHLPQGSGVIR